MKSEQISEESKCVCEQFTNRGGKGQNALNKFFGKNSLPHSNNERQTQSRENKDNASQDLLCSFI